jgi:hypothetical protein
MALTKVRGQGLESLSDGVTITTADNTDQLTLTSTDADANSGPNLRLYRNSSSPADDDFLGTIDFEGRNDNSQDFVAARIFTFTPDVSDGSEDAQLQLSMMKGGSSHIALEIKPDEFVINNGSVDIDFRVESNGQTHKLFVNGGEDVVCFGFETPETIGGIESGVQIEGTDYAGGSLSIWRNANDDAGGYLQLGKSRGTAVNSDTIVQDNDDVGIINFIGADGTDRAHPVASIRAAIDGTPGTNDMPGRLEFMTTADGGTTLSERMRIENDGDTFIGKSAAGANTAGHEFRSNGLAVHTVSGNTVMEINRITNTGILVAFNADGSAKGSISTDGSSTAYNTSSDYRLKENVDYTWDATTRLKQLKPARFNFITDDTNTLVDGFLAHEVSSVVPEAISGAKDAMAVETRYTADDVETQGDTPSKNVGDPKTYSSSVIDPQGIDQSKLVPLLVKTIQELEARIKTLEDA